MGVKKGHKPKIEGLPVIDATKDLIVSITKRDTSIEAKRKNPAECVVARACKRQTETDVRVHRSRVYVRRAKHWERYVSSNPVMKEVMSFDRGGEFEPGDYALLKPSDSQVLGVVRGPRGRPVGKKNKKREPIHVFKNVRSKIYL